MSDEHLNYIWQVVDNTAREICNDTGNVVSFEPECLSAILSFYQEKKNEYIKLKTHGTHLHRHEDAACLVVAIQRLKPLKISNSLENNKRFVLTLFPNEFLAIFVALTYIKKKIRKLYTHERSSERLYKYSDESINNFLESGFRPPSTYCDDHDNYMLWLAKTISLGCSDTYMLYSIANIFFLLEGFSFQQVSLDAMAKHD